MLTRKEVLDNAAKAVLNDRNEIYGSPEDLFTVIAKFWNTYLNEPADKQINIEPHDVAAMLSLLKIARLAGSKGAHQDSWIDLAGYAACGSECVQVSSITRHSDRIKKEIL